MSAWTWVLIGLSAAGVLLALASVVPVLRMLLRLRSRVADLRGARLFTSVESLELQRKHLEHIAMQAAPLAARAQAAVGRIRDAAHESGYSEAEDSIRAAGAQMTMLFDELR